MNNNEMKILGKEITRLHNNQDRLLECLEAVLVLARQSNNLLIASVVNECINNLEPAEVK